MSSIKYRPDIDGLRAVAVLPVLLFHLDSTLMPGGFLGVDVFFVISGYLICKIILGEIENGSFQFRKFWLRRIKRLFPVSSVVIATSMILGYFMLYVDEWKSMALQSISSLLCISNFYFWRTTNNYWGESAETMPMLHTWSLSIEEQFYLIFPIFIFLVWRSFSKRTILSIAIILMLSLLLSVAASYLARSANFYLLPTRAWELLIGCLLASITIRQQSNQTTNTLIAGVGLIAVVLSFAIDWNDGLRQFMTVGQLLATVGAAMIIWKCAPNQGIAGKLLSSPIVVFVGKISYSLYLWHWPIIVFSRHMGIRSSIGVFFGLLLAGAASYWIIEQKTRYLPMRRFVTVFGTLLIIMSFSLTLPFIVKRESVSFEPPSFWNNVDLLPGKTAIFDQHRGDFRTGLAINDKYNRESLDVAVIGDSHSMMFLPAINDICDKHGLSLWFYGAAGGTSPFFISENDNPEDFYFSNWNPKQRLDFDHFRDQFLVREKPTIIIVCCNWLASYQTLGAELFKLKTMELIDRYPNSEFILIGQPPQLALPRGGFSSGYMDFPMLRSISEHSWNAKLRNEANSAIAQIAEEYANCEFIPTEPSVTSSNGITLIENGEILYKDNSHLSVVGALRCIPAIELALAQKL